MLMRILRVLAGYVLACLAFEIVLISFIFTPMEFATLPGAGERFGMAVRLALIGAGPVMAIAAFPATVGILIAERRRIDDWLYYAGVAILIALIGFLAQYLSQSEGQPSIVNNYALTAFLAGGFAAGFVYWMVAGRHAAVRPKAPPVSVVKESPSTTAPGKA